MKNLFTSFVLFFVINLGYASDLNSNCPIAGPSSLTLNQTATFSISSNLGQCVGCYDWDISNSSNAQIQGSDTANSVQIKRIGSGEFTITVTYFNEGGCQSCTITIPAIDPTQCDLTVKILDLYLTDNGDPNQITTIYLFANPQAGQGATYTWSGFYENGNPFSVTSTLMPTPIPASLSNRIASAKVIVNYMDCEARDRKTFDCPIPYISCPSNRNGLNGEFRLNQNPIKSNLEFEGNNKDQFIISIYDASGNAMLKGIRLSDEISLEGRKPGIYFYIITDESGTIQSGKVVKQ